MPFQRQYHIPLDIPPPRRRCQPAQNLGVHQQQSTHIQKKKEAVLRHR